MAMNRTQAGKLLSGREMELFESTLREQMRGVNGKELHKRIERVRTQRDKQSDLLRRQRVATRQRTGTKDGPKGSANERTALKEQLFNEALDRLEAQQVKVQAAEQRVAERDAREKAKVAATAAKDKAAKAKAQGAGKPAGAAARSMAGLRGENRSAKAPAKGPAGKSGVQGTGPAPLALAKGKRLQAAGLQRTQAHISSSGRRAQGARDQKG